MVPPRAAERPNTARREAWARAHEWSSRLCTAFLLLLCLASRPGTRFLGLTGSGLYLWWARRRAAPPSEQGGLAIPLLKTEN